MMTAMTTMHKRPIRSGLVINQISVWLLCVGLVSFAVAQAGTPSAQSNRSAWDWTIASPESQGFSAEKLKAMTNDLAARSTSGLLVVRNDKIVCEWYAPDAGPTIPHGTASMAKAIVGGVAMAVAITDGWV